MNGGKRLSPDGTRILLAPRKWNDAGLLSETVEEPFGPVTRFVAMVFPIHSENPFPAIRTGGSVVHRPVVIQTLVPFIHSE
jgi:hypothetical protein